MTPPRITPVPDVELYDAQHVGTVGSVKPGVPFTVIAYAPVRPTEN
jgi:hypothetical protein